MNEKFNAAAFMADFQNRARETLGLSPRFYPGLYEVVDYLAQKFLVKNVPDMTSAEMENNVAYLLKSIKDQIATVQDMREGFYDHIRDIPEEIYCGILSKTDLQDREWKNMVVCDAQDMIKEADRIDADIPETFEMSDKTVRFFHMLDTYKNISFTLAGLTNFPGLLTKKDLRVCRKLLNDADNSQFPACPLNDEIQSLLPLYERALDVYAANQTATRTANRRTMTPDRS